jgi:hypothetical protein
MGVLIQPGQNNLHFEGVENGCHLVVHRDGRKIADAFITHEKCRQIGKYLTELGNRFHATVIDVSGEKL